MDARRRWLLFGPLLALPAVVLVLASLTGAMHGAGRVGVVIDRPPAGSPLDGVTFTTDPVGDYLTAEVGRGRSLVVLGYTGEPALRVHPDGRAERNENATIGTAGPDDPQPAEVPDPGGPERWVPAGSAGTVSWHDHRAHWFAGTPDVDDGSAVGRWLLPMTADGKDSSLAGRLVWHEPQAGRLLLILAVASASAIVLRRWSRAPRHDLARVVLGVGALSTVMIPFLTETSGAAATTDVALALATFAALVVTHRLGPRIGWSWVVGIPALLGATWFLARRQAFLLPTAPEAWSAQLESLLMGAALGAEVVLLLAAFRPAAASGSIAPTG